MLGAAPAPAPNILGSLSPECTRKGRRGSAAASAHDSQTLGTRAWASLGRPASLQPCRVDSCLHFFRVMNTLPDNRHFWKSLVSSVRN